MDLFGAPTLGHDRTATASTVLVNVILQTHDQWELWIQQVKQRAADARIWTMIDPEREYPPEFIPKPKIPRYADVSEGATRLSDLSREEKDDFRSLQESYRVEDTEWVRETNALQSIHQYICERVSIENQSIISTSTNPYDTLRLLKSRLYPSDESSKFEAKRQWHMLPLLNARNQEWEKYVNTWSTVYRRAKALSLPEVEGKMPHILFVLSIKKLDENWGDQRHSEILSPSYVTVDFENLLDSYREYKRQKISFSRLHQVSNNKDNMAFNAEASTPSFQGQHAQPSRPACPCGNTSPKHRIASCWYITKNPKEGWEPRAKIAEKVAKALQDAKVRSIVEKEKAAKERAIKARSEKKEDANGNRFNPEVDQNPTLDSFHTVTEEIQTEVEYVEVEETTHDKSPPDRIVSTNDPFCSFNAAAEEPYYFTNAWIIDGASDRHVCNSPHRNNFTKTRETDHRTIKCGRSVYPIECYGTCTIIAKTPEGHRPVILKDVALCLYFRTNLISAAKMNDNGLHLITFNGGYICSEKSPNTPIYLPERVQNFWCFEFLPPTNHEFAIHPGGEVFHTTDHMTRKTSKLNKLLTTKADDDLWHERMGHAGPNTLKHLPNAVLGNITITNAPVTLECDTCATSKATQVISRSNFKEHSATKSFTRINYDIVHMSRGYNGDRYISHFSCEFSSFQFVYTHPTKEEAVRCCVYVINLIRTHFGTKVQFFHVDGETTLGKETTMENKFYDFIRANGIIVEVSAPHTQDQNGAAEVHGKNLLIRARSIRIHSGQPYSLWPEHVKCACIISNKTPMEKLGWKTPFEIVYGRKPTIHYFVSPGSKAYALNKSIPKNLKTEPRAFIGYHVGYEGTNIFRIWVPSQRKVIRTRDVKFNEKEHTYDPTETDTATEATEMTTIILQPSIELNAIQELDGTIEVVCDQEVEEGQLASKVAPISTKISQQAAILRGDNIARENTQQLEPGRSGRGRFEYQLSQEQTIGLDIDEGNIIHGRRTRRSQKDSEEANTTHHTTYEGENEGDSRGFFTTSLAFHTAVTAVRQHRDHLPPPPANYQEAQQHPLWPSIDTAIQKEYASIQDQEVFELLPQDPQRKPIPLKWVFSYKFNSEGYLVKVKARLCVRGDKQEVSELDTYAATLAAETMRFLLAIAAYFDLEMRQFDAVAAFLNCPLDETVHCRPPAGFPSPGRVWKLKRALYGLRRAPHLWHTELSTYLESLDLKAVPGVNCVYQNEWLVVFFFVDDIICIYRAENQMRFNNFQESISSKYKLSVIGEPQWFLGIRITRNRKTRSLTICQDSYIDKICKRFEESLFQKDIYTPLPAAMLLRNEGQASEGQILEMQQKVGSINFAAVISRPDIALAASMLAEHLKNPSAYHLEAANHCLSYLNSTRSFSITYQGNNNAYHQFAFANQGYAHISSDASFADDKTTRRSRQGYLFSLFGGPIAWKASKQNTVTTSSTEAELLALSQVGKEVIWWKNFFDAINFRLPQKILINCDNRQTIRLLTTESPKLTTKLRHVDIHHHWLRQEIARNHINISWISTNSMPADGFTKTLTCQKHEHFLSLLNLRPRSNEFDPESRNSFQSSQWSRED